MECRYEKRREKQVEAVTLAGSCSNADLYPVDYLYPDPRGEHVVVVGVVSRRHECVCCTLQAVSAWTISITLIRRDGGDALKNCPGGNLAQCAVQLLFITNACAPKGREKMHSARSNTSRNI